jgi:hypothetical protein
MRRLSVVAARNAADAAGRPVAQMLDTAAAGELQLVSRREVKLLHVEGVVDQSEARIEPAGRDVG